MRENPFFPAATCYEAAQRGALLSCPLLFSFPILDITLKRRYAAGRAFQRGAESTARG